MELKQKILELASMGMDSRKVFLQAKSLETCTSTGLVHSQELKAFLVDKKLIVRIRSFQNDASPETKENITSLLKRLNQTVRIDVGNESPMFECLQELLVLGALTQADVTHILNLAVTRTRTYPEITLKYVEGVMMSSECSVLTVSIMNIPDADYSIMVHNGECITEGVIKITNGFGEFRCNAPVGTNVSGYLSTTDKSTGAFNGGTTS